MSLRHVNLWLPKIQIKPTYWKNSKKKCHKIKRGRTTTATTTKKHLLLPDMTGNKNIHRQSSKRCSLLRPSWTSFTRRKALFTANELNRNILISTWHLQHPILWIVNNNKKFCITIVSSLGKNQGSLAIILLNRQVTVHAVKTICWKKNE